jgi:phospholipase/lecithinase/hemolysin
MKKKIIWSFLLVSLLIFRITDGFAEPFDEIVMFGDSLSDNGNLILINDQPMPDPELYYQGRFSNGPVWVEYLSDSERLNVSLNNRAFGGAKTDGVAPPGLIAQVIEYITVTDFSLSPDTLFIIWIGGNDCLYGDRNHQTSVANIKEAIQQLAGGGAMHILVLNLPDLGTIPKELDTPGAVEATEFSVNFNADLANMLDEYSVRYPGISLYEFDVYSFFMKVLKDPEAFGFTNVTDPSPNFTVPNDFDGAGHAFWDDIHPTTSMHTLIADQVFDNLNTQLPVNGEDGSEGGAAAESSCFIRSMGWKLLFK